MRVFISSVICLLLLQTAAAITRKPSMSQQDLDKRWQQYLAGSMQMQATHKFPFKHCFSQSADKHQLPESLLLAVARGESNFDPKARSSANAYGLMQILWPSTAKDLGIDSLQQLLNPCVNVDAGARYIRQLLDRYQGNLHKAIAAYNYGPGRIPSGELKIPTGAAWYSDYILHHLDYVLQHAGGGSDPMATKRMVILAFDRPYRASAFIRNLQPGFGDIRLDYFRDANGRFRVFMLYDSKQQEQRGMQRLRELGFRL